MTGERSFWVTCVIETLTTLGLLAVIIAGLVAFFS